MTNPIDWLVFDLGGVIVEVAPSERLVEAITRQSGTDAARVRELLAEKHTARPFSVQERFQTGELDEAGFHAAVNEQLKRPMTFDALNAEFENLLCGEDPAMLDLLERLSKDHRLACLSNTNATHWRVLQRDYQLFKHLKAAFASHEIGYAKPDARAFGHVADALGVDRSRCLLIDDRPINVDGARSAGWKAVQFHDAAALEAELADLDIAPGRRA